MPFLNFIVGLTTNALVPWAKHLEFANTSWYQIIIEPVSDTLYISSYKVNLTSRTASVCRSLFLSEY